MHLNKAIMVVCATLAQYGLAILPSTTESSGGQMGTCATDKQCFKFDPGSSCMLPKDTSPDTPVQENSACTTSGYHFCCLPPVKKKNPEPALPPFAQGQQPHKPTLSWANKESSPEVSSGDDEKNPTWNGGDMTHKSMDSSDSE